jgi:hypothetical protein
MIEIDLNVAEKLIYGSLGRIYPQNGLIFKCDDEGLNSFKNQKEITDKFTLVITEIKKDLFRVILRDK